MYFTYHNDYFDPIVQNVRYMGIDIYFHAPNVVPEAIHYIHRNLNTPSQAVSTVSIDASIDKLLLDNGTKITDFIQR